MTATKQGRASGKKSALGRITNTASVEGGEVDKTILRFAMQQAAKELIPQERIKICLRYHQPGKQTVDVLRHDSAKKAYYSGLMVCGSIWHCPVCASRISEHRKNELTRAVNDWTGGVLMVTYTASHKISTPLREILGAVTDGVRAFKSGEAFQKIKSRYGWMGSVKALEVTYGQNGWHPHVHELTFTTNPLNEERLEQLEIELRGHWIAILGRHGYVASTQRGLVVSDDHYDLTRYIAKFGHEPKVSKEQWKNKWSIAHEVTKAVVKTAKQGGRTPNQLLIDYITGDDEAADAWREYAICFKGKKQLTWSNGLRKLLGIGEEKPDSEIAEEIPENTTIYARFNLDQWKQILRHELRGEILSKAGYMSQEDFANWIGGTIDGWKE